MKQIRLKLPLLLPTNKTWQMHSSLTQCTVALYQKLISNREMDFHRFCLPLFCCKSVLIWFVGMYMHEVDCMLCVCLYFLCICSVFVVADYNSWRGLLMPSERNITCCDEHCWSWLTNFHIRRQLTSSDDQHQCDHYNEGHTTHCFSP